jgi:hypothetical protein
MSSQKLWVQHNTTGNIFIDKVSIDGCSDIAEFLKEIKKEFEIPGPSSHLTLYKSDGTTEIDVEDSPAHFLKENSRRNPLVVRIVEIAEKPSISSSRHQEYKHSKAIHSSRSYLTSIAVALEELYDIQKIPERQNIPATFGDILWNKSRNPQPKSPHSKPLHQMFLKNQWQLLYNLNEAVNGHLHMELETVNGSKCVILPIEFSHLSNDVKAIALKSQVVANESDLVVKSEGSVSGGSPDSNKKTLV